MKLSNVLMLIVFSSALFSCKKDLTGSGTLITQQRQTGTFNALTSKGDFKVIIKKAQANTIELTGEDNVLAKIVTDVSNGNLTIRYDNDVKTHQHKQAVVNIGMPSVSKVQLEGSGNIQSQESWNAPDFNATLNGSGEIDITAAGDVYRGEINGSGTLKMNGAYNSATLTISGSGKINGYPFTTGNADVKIDGSGKCEIKVTNKLKAKITGSGRVYYKGTPDTNITVVGSGGAEKVN